jgi:hypothetical protein
MNKRATSSAAQVLSAHDFKLKKRPEQKEFMQDVTIKYERFLVTSARGCGSQEGRNVDNHLSQEHGVVKHSDGERQEAQRPAANCLLPRFTW